MGLRIEKSRIFLNVFSLSHTKTTIKQLLKQFISINLIKSIKNQYDLMLTFFSLKLQFSQSQECLVKKSRFVIRNVFWILHSRLIMGAQQNHFLHSFIHVNVILWRCLTTSRLRQYCYTYSSERHDSHHDIYGNLHRTMFLIYSLNS